MPKKVILEGKNLPNNSTQVTSMVTPFDGERDNITITDYDFQKPNEFNNLNYFLRMMNREQNFKEDFRKNTECSVLGSELENNTKNKLYGIREYEDTKIDEIKKYKCNLFEIEPSYIQEPNDSITIVNRQKRNGFNMFAIPFEFKTDYKFNGGEYIFINSMSIVLFKSENLRDKIYNRYENDSVESYRKYFLYSQYGTIDNSISVGIRTYYKIKGISGRGTYNSRIIAIPNINPELNPKKFKKLQKMYNINKYDLNNTNLLINVIETIKEPSSDDDDSHIEYNILYVPSNNKADLGAPILINKKALDLIFDSRDSAFSFLTLYKGDLLNYFLELTKKENKKEIDKVVYHYKDNKKSLLKKVVLIAGSTVITIIIEQLIEYAIKNKK